MKCAECVLAFEERAAILEFDAGLTRAEAESKAQSARCYEHRIDEQIELDTPPKSRVE